MFTSNGIMDIRGLNDEILLLISVILSDSISISLFSVISSKLESVFHETILDILVIFIFKIIEEF